MVELMFWALLACCAFWWGAVVRSLEGVRLQLEHDAQEQQRREVMPMPASLPPVVDEIQTDVNEAGHNIDSSHPEQVDITVDGHGAIHWHEHSPDA